MRIVHVTDVYAPRVGGIERQIAALVREQRTQGHDAHVLAPSGAHGDDVVRAWGSADVVHGHLSVVSPFTTARLRDAAGAGIPTAITVHSMWPSGGVAASAFRLALGIAGPVGAWGAVSRVAAERVQRCLPPSTPVAVVPNGIDVGWWTRPLRGGDVPDGPVHAVMVNRLAGRKRVLPLLAALARRNPPDVRLTIVGDGPHRSRVQRFVHRHGLADRVTVTGSLRPVQVRALLHTADVFLAPADRESFGIAALEARAAGVPVLGRVGSGVADLVTPGVDGFVVDDEQDLADTLAVLASARDVLGRMQTAARATPPTAGIADSAAATAALYAAAGAAVPVRVP